MRYLKNLKMAYEKKLNIYENVIKTKKAKNNPK